MNIRELTEFMESYGLGRYEVHHLGDGCYIVTPLAHNELLITKEAHKQNQEWFRNHGG